MNQTQVNNFLTCLLNIDDFNYMALHARAHAVNALNGTENAIKYSHTHNDTHQHDHHHDHEGHDHDHEHHHYELIPDHNHEHQLGFGQELEHNPKQQLLIAKVTAMSVLFFATTLCAAIPFLLNRYFKWTDSSSKNAQNTRSSLVIKSLLYFGGGVLLCTTFQHLLPEVQELIELLQDCQQLPKLPFALAELLMCAGFFLMYFIEELIHAYIHWNKRLMARNAGAAAAFERGHSVRNSYLVKGAAKQKSNAEQELPSTQSQANGNAALTLSVQDLLTNDVEQQKSQQQLQHYQQHHHHQVSNHNDLQHNDHQHAHAHKHHMHAHSHSHSHAHNHSHLPITAAQQHGSGDGAASDAHDDMITSSIRGLFIVLALSLHELFEGMAIGLEGSAGSVWFMFGAVSAHKLVLAFCVGVELIVARTRHALSVVYILTFAVVSPIGIAIGILISHHQDTGTASVPSVTSAVLQGLACGTLLYVVFFEILSKNHSGMTAYLALFIGFAVMFGLQQISTDSHGHSHGSCSSGHNHDHHMDASDHHHDHENTHVEHVENNFVEQLQILRQASKKLLEETKRNVD